MKNVNINDAYAHCELMLAYINHQIRICLTILNLAVQGIPSHTGSKPGQFDWANWNTGKREREREERREREGEAARSWWRPAEAAEGHGGFYGSVSSDRTFNRQIKREGQRQYWRKVQPAERLSEGTGRWKICERSYGHETNVIAPIHSLYFFLKTMMNSEADNRFTSFT